MKKITIKLNNNVKWALWGAISRYKYTGEKKTLDSNLLGLGYKTNYKDIVKVGLMTCSFRPPAKRCMGWYKLTDLGKKVVRQLIRRNMYPKSSNDIDMNIDLSEITVMVK